MTNEHYYAATGRRKNAVARVRLHPGKGDILINDKPMEELFVRLGHQQTIRRPLEVTETLDKFRVQAKVAGGGVSGWAGAPMHGPYGAAKAGVMALTRTMAVELGKYGIRVNAVAPGSIRTPRTMAGTSEEARDASARRVIPLQRTGRPEEIAAAPGDGG